MEPEKAIEFLTKQREEIKSLEKLKRWGPDYQRWEQLTSAIVNQIWGKDSTQLDRFVQVKYRPTIISTSTPDSKLQEYYLETLGDYEAVLLALTDEIRVLGLAGKRPSQKLDPSSIFDSLDLHREIKRVSAGLFHNAHYAESIEQAYKALDKYVQKKSGRTDLYGKDLMAQVFTPKKPVLALNALQNQSEIDEQEGFMLIFMGSMVGIRNPKAHEVTQQKDPYRTIEYLTLASLLAKRVDESKKVG